MDKQVLKMRLKAIKNKGYAVPDCVNPFELSRSMMEFIGDSDSELRDGLIYSILYTWVDRGTLSNGEVHELFKIALDDEHLMKGLGEIDDSVFCRAFSVLIVAIAVMRHRRDSYLSKESLDGALERVLECFNRDHDTRGYVNGKGWADGISHAADALDEFARCIEIGNEGLLKILDAIHHKVNINYSGFIYFEDERMVTAVQGVLERNIVSQESIENWIARFSEIDMIGKYPEDLLIRANVTIFLKSLFVRLISDPKYSDTASVVKRTLDTVNPYSAN